jgi:plastocyanin
MTHPSRRSLAPSVLLAIVIGLVGCGEDPSDIDANRPAPESEPAEAPEEEEEAVETTAATAAPTTVPTGDAVTITDFAFDPPSIALGVGDELTWTNSDGATHSIASADGSIASSELEEGDEFGFVFDDAGTYTYFCGIHNAMTGTVVVE